MGLGWFTFGDKKFRKKAGEMEERHRCIKKGEERVQHRKAHPHDSDLLSGMTVAKIPSKIKGLESRSQMLRDNCLRVLQIFTVQEIGPNPEAWRDWYEVNKGRPQHEWWADQLGHRGYNTYGLELGQQVEVILKAMREADAITARAAARLLGHITGTAVKFAPEGTPKMRKWHINKWLAMYEKRKGRRP
jgi:hypothetical protein